MKNPHISRVKDNMDKYRTYATLMERYKKALDEQFYFEALIITYAMQEDRLRFMLYYMGTFDTRNSSDVSEKTKQDLAVLLHNKCGENAGFKLNNITGKMNLIEAVIVWAESANENENEYSFYLRELKSLMESVDVDDVLRTFREMEKWLEFRNEVIHASLNKNIDALYDGLDEKIEQGMQYARALNGYVRVMKKDNSLRKNLNMGD